MSKQEQNKQLLEGEHSVKGQVQLLTNKYSGTKDFSDLFGIKVPDSYEDKDIGSIWTNRISEMILAIRDAKLGRPNPTYPDGVNRVDVMRFLLDNVSLEQILYMATIQIEVMVDSALKEQVDDMLKQLKNLAQEHRPKKENGE